MKMNKRAFLFSSLYYPNVGGVENSLKEFSFVLKEKGYEVTVITSNRDNVNGGYLKNSDLIDGIPVIRCNYPRNIFGFVVFLVSLRMIVKGLGISNDDFVISRSHWPVLALRSCCVKDVKYLVPSIYFFQEKLTLSYIFSKKILGYIVNVFAQFLALSWSKVYVFSKDMVNQSKCASLGLCEPIILKPGVSTERFFQVDLDAKLNIRKSLGIESNKKYLLCVGRLTEVKQFNIAVDALKCLGDEYHLLLVGSGPELDALKTQVESECLKNRVTMRSFTNCIDLYYKAADIYLMTSRYESFGQVLLEATACGLPVIAFSKAAGVRTSVSYIYEGYESLLYECHEQTYMALAKTIMDLKIDDIKFKKEVSLFRECYSWKMAIEKMM